jgi:hypothetical protein
MRRLLFSIAVTLSALASVMWAYGCSDSPVDPASASAQVPNEVMANQAAVRAGAASSSSKRPFWTTSGNPNTDPSSHFLGTLDDQPLIFKTNGEEVMRLIPGPRVGIGTNNPRDFLHLYRNAPTTVGVLMGNSHVGPGRSGFLVNYHASGQGAELWNFNDTHMWFGTNNRRRMTIRNDGDVGIGTHEPAARFHVKSGDSFEEMIIEETRTGGAVQLELKNTTRGWIVESDADPDHFRILSEAGGPTRFSIRGSSGYVGINTDTPSERLHVNGNVLANAHLTPSSERWKDNITPIEGALEKVLRLQGVSFDWTSDGRHDLGLIAEEVGEVLPEVVAYDGANASSVDYARLVAILIEAVKEQQQQIDELRARSIR